MSLLESELLFLNSEAGEYELEGDIASTHLPTSLSQSIRLRLAKVEERDPALDLVLKLCACMGGSMTLVSAEVSEAPLRPRQAPRCNALLHRLLREMPVQLSLSSPSLVFCAPVWVRAWHRRLPRADGDRVLRRRSRVSAPSRARSRRRRGRCCSRKARSSASPSRKCCSAGRARGCSSSWRRAACAAGACARARVGLYACV